MAVIMEESLVTGNVQIKRKILSDEVDTSVQSITTEKILIRRVRQFYKILIYVLVSLPWKYK